METNKQFLEISIPLVNFREKNTPEQGTLRLIWPLTVLRDIDLLKRSKAIILGIDPHFFDNTVCFYKYVL